MSPDDDTVRRNAPAQESGHALSDSMPAFSFLPNLGFKCFLFVWCLLGSGVSWAGFLHSQGSPTLPPPLLEFLSF